MLLPGMEGKEEVHTLFLCSAAYVEPRARGKGWREGMRLSRGLSIQLRIFLLFSRG